MVQLSNLFPLNISWTTTTTTALAIQQQQQYKISNNNNNVNLIAYYHQRKNFPSLTKQVTKNITNYVDQQQLKQQ